MSIRFILLILLGWILWGFIRRRYKRFLQHQRETSPFSPPVAPKHGAMVRCDYCGLHIPAEEAFLSENTYYCCEEHKHLAQQAK